MVTGQVGGGPEALVGNARGMHTQRIRMTDWVLLLASLLVLGGLVTYARF